MIVVRIELWPLGNRSRARDLGTLVIANDATGDHELGNYNAALAHVAEHVGKPGCWRAGRVEQHPRRLSAYHLVARALTACLAGRRNKTGDRLVDGVRASDAIQAVVDRIKEPEELRS